MDDAANDAAPQPPGSAFGRDARLRNRWQLDVMRERGSKAAGRRFVLIVLKSPPDGTRRVAFLISRKFSLLAVERNRARRLFREVFRRWYPSLPPVWLLFIPRQRLKDAKLADLLQELPHLAERAGLPPPADDGGGEPSPCLR